MRAGGLNIYPVLLAGGTGTRLWPISRELTPKQLVNFMGSDSLIQSTIKRLQPVLDWQHVRIVCGEEHQHEIARHLEGIGIAPEGKIIAEPCGRNTAPAILLAVLQILHTESDAILCIFPADHVIEDIAHFHENLASAVQLAADGYIVTFGIKPRYPETGYGYIEGKAALPCGGLTIQRFVEKPDLRTAEAYLEKGNFFWNSGMFAFRASVMLEEFRVFQPELLQSLEQLFNTHSINQSTYGGLTNISIDYAIMENTEKGALLPSDFGWSDIGSWKSLYDFLPKDDNQNVLEGDVITKDTRGCLVIGNERLVATNHIQDTVIVETPDAVFVSDLENSRDVKEIVNKLKATDRREYHKHNTVYLPWGSYTVLEKKAGIKVSRLVIYPDSSCPIEILPGDWKHFTAVDGSVKIVTAAKDLILSVGDSCLFSQAENITLVNQQPSQVQMIQVKWIGDESVRTD
jgi:mannose-1-phosphate guanylyltransferase/mannose-6-phosphate isomerase